MYRRYKTSILNPSRIPLCINKKIISVLYFLILGIIYILPNLIYVVSTGGIDNSYFVEIVDELRGEEINYVLMDNTLTNVNMLGDVESFSTDTLQITFTAISDQQLEQDVSSIYKEICSLSKASIKLLFTEKRVIGLFDYQGIIVDFDLGTYEEFNVGNINIKNTNNQIELNNFSRLLHSIHDKYKTLIILVTIPSLLLGGFVALALTLLIPSFVLYIFNRGLRVKFGTIYHMSIYAFTIYILGSTLLYMFGATYITLLLEIVSFIYLSIAMRNYAITKKGGFKREL